MAQDVQTSPGSRKARYELRYEIDAHLPAWARRTHPIVRRHLGQFWRVMPVPYDTLFQIFLWMSGAVLLTIWFEFLFTVALPISIVSIAILLGLVVYYARTLYELSVDSSVSMVREIEGATLDTLRTTPFTTREILLSKIAGSIWLSGEPLSVIMSTLTYSQLPTFMLIGMVSHDLMTDGAGVQLAMIALYGASILRIPLEMFMVAAIGQYIGLTTPGRSTASVSTLTVIALYFMLVYGLWFINTSLVMSIILRVVIPVVLPVVVSAGIIELSRRRIEAS